jgi:hypothetical protein
MFDVLYADVKASVNPMLGKQNLLKRHGALAEPYRVTQEAPW